MSRVLPLFLAEQVAFGSNAEVQTLVQWLLGDSPGFIVSAAAWADDLAAEQARKADNNSDYVVITHIQAIRDPWTVELRLVRTIDAKCLGTLTSAFPSAKPDEGLPALARQLLDLLREQAEIEPATPPSFYQVPSPPHFGTYLLRLEQLLAVRCAGMDGVPAAYLNGEREIMDGNLQLCLDFPQNVGLRILLAQTLKAMKRARPLIIPEFKNQIALLQKEKPLPGGAQQIVQRLINEGLSES